MLAVWMTLARLSIKVGSSRFVSRNGARWLTWTSGRYYDQDRPTMAVNPQADDLELAEALWQRSAELVGLPHTA